MISAVIFDYFGVIRTTGIRSAYIQLGGDLHKDEAFVADVTIAGNYGFIHDVDEQLAGRLGVDLTTWREAVSGAHGNDPMLLHYIEKTLRKRLCLKTALLSNANSQAAADYFEPGELERYFDAALFSGAVGYAKPEAAAYRLTAERLGVSPTDCIMVDDREEFCRGAERVGMHAIVYRNFAQCTEEIKRLLAQSM